MIQFSIVINTYQRDDNLSPHYLQRALNSVLNQTYQNFKIFLIGDKYENNDEFISILNKINSEKIYYENLTYAKERDKYKSTNKELLWKYGGCNANNYGIQKSLGDGFEYICHLDHDDEWYPNHLELLNDAINRTGALWLCTKSEYINNLVYPTNSSELDLIPYRPKPENLIHSSTCINFKEIPLRYRDVYEETGKSGYPADADLWERISKFMEEKNIHGFIINKITCKHKTEGYEKR